MIIITIKLDSVDDGTDENMDGISYSCDWKIISPEITLLEKNSAEFILEKIEKILEEIGLNAMLAGGSVERIEGKDE